MIPVGLPEAFRLVDRPLLLVRADGVVLAATEQAAELLGHSSGAALTGRMIGELFSAEPSDLLRDLRIAMTTPSVPLRWSFGVDGVGVQTELVRDDSTRQIIGLLLTLGDPAQLQQHFSALTVELKDANRAAADARRDNAELQARFQHLQQFAYAMAHDLKAPLRHVSALLAFLRNDLGDGVTDETLELIDTAQQSAAELGQLVTDMLDYGRLGSRALDPKRVVLDDVIGDLVAELASDLDEIGGRIVLPTVLGEVRADPVLLRRVLANLLENAVKFRSDLRPLCVEVRATRGSGGEVRALHVVDNGKGFDSRNAEQIFEPFRRAHGAGVPGSGIGLATCRVICAMHGWTIEAQSEEGASATFTIRFDVTDVSAATTPLGDVSAS